MISVVVPAYNEEKNISELHSQIRRASKDCQIIFVDDGSTDNTFLELEKLKKKDKNLVIIKFRKNFGQTAAWRAGFDNATGDVVVTMDADLQNDPEDIPKLVKKIDEGYDVVSGWRQKRKDSLSKKSFSLLSRFLRGKMIGDEIHDSGCSLKAYRKECLADLELHGEMHRYIAELLAFKGYKIGEVKVNHRPRTKGKTKYGLIRLPKGLLDLVVVLFWQKYSDRPIHLFGGLGLLMSMIGTAIAGYLVYMKIFFGESLANRPLLLLAVLLIILGIQAIIFGLIADVLSKIYYKEKRAYNIEKIVK
ncbi:MAG: glycosyltransferase family 2 protein [Candidatus Woesearchaeota archaeon]|nr:glycosyltransferase family 2 protein [Candidatus Woesearchaeota archaeon]